MANSRHEERVEKALELEAQLEAELFGPDVQGEVDPVEESSEAEVELTDPTTVPETVPEVAQERPSEEGTLRKELADLQHRFNRMKGSNDSTIFGLRKEVTNLNNQVAAYLKEIAELKVTTAPEAVSNFDSVFTQDVVDVLGEAQVNAIKTVITGAEDAVADVKRQMEASKVSKHEEAAKAAQTVSEVEFMRELRRLVPDLDKMNHDDGFNDWLRLPGPDGIDRIDRLHKDQHDNDFYRVAQFFIDYKETLNTPEVATRTQVKDSVQGHMGPTGTQSSSSNTMKNEDTKGFMYQSKINEYNRAVARGDYRDKISQAEAMEMKIFKAMNENKIILDEHPVG